jgi:hypothetical protein
MTVTDQLPCFFRARWRRTLVPQQAGAKPASLSSAKDGDGEPAHDVQPRRHTLRMRIRPIDLVGVSVSPVVLGVFIQLFPAVMSESFPLGRLTAVLMEVVLMEVVLEVVLRVKQKNASGFSVNALMALDATAEGRRYRALGQGGSGPRSHPEVAPRSRVVDLQRYFSRQRLG